MEVQTSNQSLDDGLDPEDGSNGGGKRGECQMYFKGKLGIPWGSSGFWGPGSIPGWRTKIPHAAWHSQKKKKKKGKPTWGMEQNITDN